MKINCIVIDPHALQRINTISKINSHDALRFTNEFSTSTDALEFLEENNAKQVTGLFVKSFNSAIEAGKSDKANTILQGLKGFIVFDKSFFLNNFSFF